MLESRAVSPDDQCRSDPKDKTSVCQAVGVQMRLTEGSVSARPPLRFASHTGRIPKRAKSRYTCSHSGFVLAEAFHDDFLQQMWVDRGMYAEDDGEEFCMFCCTTFLQEMECLELGSVSFVLPCLARLTVIWMSFGMLVLDN